MIRPDCRVVLMLLLAWPLALAAADRPAATQRDVHVNRVALNAKELASLEQAYRVRILDGRYGYDKVSGA